MMVPHIQTVRRRLTPREKDPGKTTRCGWAARSVLLALALTMAASGAAQATDIEAVTRYDYDGYGHRTHVESPLGGTRQYAFNFQGKERAVSFDGTSIITDTEFGAHGNVEAFSYTSAPLAGSQIRESRRAALGYDSLERLTHLALSTDGSVGFDYQATDFEYDERGFLRSQRRADRAVGDALVHYDYTAQGQLERFDWNGQQIGYTYDPRGNLIGRSEALGVAALDACCEYGLDNRRSDWTYDDAGRVLQDDTRSYEYDDAGRVRLVRSLETGTWLAHYLYDSSGRRVRVLEPDQVTYSYRDSKGTLIAEETHDRALELKKSKDFVHFGGTKVMAATYRADQATEIELQFANYQGSPAVAWGLPDSKVHEYSPFGLALSVGSASAHQGAHGFTGHEDDGTGLVYMQARYYSADLARFQQPDLIRDFDPYSPSTFNLYQYVGNNPIGFVDPTGLGKIKWGKVFKGGLKIGLGIVAAGVAIAAAPALLTAAGAIAIGVTVAAGGVAVADGAITIAEGFGADVKASERGHTSDAAANFASHIGVDPRIGRATHDIMLLGTYLRMGQLAHPYLSPAAAVADDAAIAIKAIQATAQAHDDIFNPTETVRTTTDADSWWEVLTLTAEESQQLLDAWERELAEAEEEESEGYDDPPPR